MHLLESIEDTFIIEYIWGQKPAKQTAGLKSIHWKAYLIILTVDGLHRAIWAFARISDSGSYIWLNIFHIYLVGSDTTHWQKPFLQS